VIILAQIASVRHPSNAEPVARREIGEMMLKMNYSATAVASNYHQQPSNADNKLPLRLPT